MNGLVTTTNSVGNPTNTNSSIVDYGNGWFRISISAALSPSSGSFNFEFNKSPNATPTFENFGRINQTTTTDDKVYVYGGQLEQLPYATSYIPTAGSTATRLGETANNAGDVNVFNSEEGVLYAEMAALEDVTTSKDISILNSSGDNYVLIRAYTRFLNVIVRAEGSTQFFQDIEMNEITSINKFAVKYKQNDFALWVNGVERLTDTSGNTPTGLNRLAFDSGGNRFYGKVRNVQVFNKALTDRELEILTIQ